MDLKAEGPKTGPQPNVSIPNELQGKMTALPDLAERHFKSV
jgi:hypothetical protein